MLYIEIFYVRILFLYASTVFHFYHGPQRGTPGYLSPITIFRLYSSMAIQGGFLEPEHLFKKAFFRQ